jgi:hypothetical protein
MMSRKKVGQKYSTDRAKRSLEDVPEFKYLVTTLRDKTAPTKRLSRLKSGNACYHSVQSFVFPPAL